MDRREFLATSGAAAALLAPAPASGQNRSPDAASGRTVVDITDFGIAPGDDDRLAVANSAAVDKLLAYLLANDPTPEQPGTGAIRVTAPAGHFRFARPWAVKCALWLEGQSNSHRYGYATHFDFDTAGFQFHAAWTGPQGLVDPPTTGADGFRLENLFCTSRAPAGTGHHGIYAVCRGDIVRCTTFAFPGDGIRVETLSGFGAGGRFKNNANGTRILYCQSGGNGGCGIRLMNGDANCVVTIGCDLHRNGGFGLYDNAFLSNSHTGHHAEGNGLGRLYPEHKAGPRGAACSYPVAAWAPGVNIAVSADGTFRTHAGKRYRLLRQGRGRTASAPTHTSRSGSSPAIEADGYQWAYEGTELYRRYHVAIDHSRDASTTVPGTDPTIWVPYEWDPDNGTRKDIPVWTKGQTWTEGGSYGGSSHAGDVVWTACYMEGDGQPLSQIGARQIWVGGQGFLSTWSKGVQVKANGGALENPYGFIVERPFHDGGKLSVHMGSALPAGRVLVVSHQTVHPQLFMMRGGFDTDFFLEGQADPFLTMTGPNTAFTGGRSTAQPGVVNVPNLFVGSGADARKIDYASAAPTGGYHAQGEIVLNTAPSAGGKLGWVCTAAGTPGTWKGFGAIDP